MFFSKKDSKKNIYPMLKWAKDLFPICRSLTGEGNRLTIKYFKRLNPEFKNLKFKTGKKVFDWTIPYEWNVKDAFIQHQSGKKFAEFKKNNLHLVGYSIPIKKVLSKNKILKRIFTEKKQPSAIPYVTSYYNRDWGFCLSEKQKKKLPKGKYKVFINSSLKKGYLDIIHSKLKGKKKQEIFFSSYFCHPSMANNELSGPTLLNAIMLYKKKNYPKSLFTYRFVLHPETIGSIAYLSKYKSELKKNVICGFNLTCVGDERSYSYVSSPYGNTLADMAMESSLRNLQKVKKYSYMFRGSDERQYCAPGIELPLCSFSRSKEYPEYHTNKDDFSVVTQKGLQGSFEVIKTIIDCFESCFKPKYVHFGEPNLGKRNLYPKFSKKNTYSDELILRKHLLAYANGKRNIFEISNILKTPLKKTLNEYKFLRSHKIIK